MVDHSCVDAGSRVASGGRGVVVRGRGVCMCVFVDSLRAVVNHPQVDADFRVPSDCYKSGARSLQVNAF